MLIHGNSSSSRAFGRQLDGALGRRFRLVAIDLPGYGASDKARDPSAYSLPGHARAVRVAVDALGLREARFVGWSLGGHVVLEMAPDLPEARGFMIFGTPPIGPPPSIGKAFLPHPVMRTVTAERIDRDRAEALVAAMFAPGFADVPPFFLEDVLRADGRARKFLAASLAPGGFRDQVAVVRDLEVAARRAARRRGAARQRRLFRLARHADALARRGADHSRRRPRPAMGDAAGLRRAARGVHWGYEVSAGPPFSPHSPS